MANLRMLPRAAAVDPTSPLVPGVLSDVDSNSARSMFHHLSIGTVGTTAQRPALNTMGQTIQAGTYFIDTSLSKVIFFDGANWRDPFTGSVV